MPAVGRLWPSDDDDRNDEEGGSYLNLAEPKVFLLLPVISDVNKLAPEREIFELLEMKMTVTMTEGSSGKQPCCKITRHESATGMKLTVDNQPMTIAVVAKKNSNGLLKLSSPGGARLVQRLVSL